MEQNYEENFQQQPFSPLRVERAMSIYLSGRNINGQTLVLVGEALPEKKRPLSDFSTKAGVFAIDGSPGRIRTGDLSINSRMLYR